MIPIANTIFGIFIPILGISYSILNKISKNYYKNANFYRKASIKLKNLQLKNETEIKKYLHQINCKNADYINTKKILPALARYQIWLELKEKFLNEIEKINNMLQTQTENKKFTHKMQKTIYEFEKEILKINLNLAFLIHIIENPEDQRRLKDLGKESPLSFSKRISSLKNGDKEDIYFLFNDKIQEQRKLKGVSFNDVVTLKSHELSELVFSN
jgi:hypothetical protein